MKKIDENTWKILGQKGIYPKNVLEVIVVPPNWVFTAIKTFTHKQAGGTWTISNCNPEREITPVAPRGKTQRKPGKWFKAIETYTLKKGQYIAVGFRLNSMKCKLYVAQ